MPRSIVTPGECSYVVPPIDALISFLSSGHDWNGSILLAGVWSHSFGLWQTLRGAANSCHANLEAPSAPALDNKRTAKSTQHAMNLHPGGVHPGKSARRSTAFTTHYARTVVRRSTDLSSFSACRDLTLVCIWFEACAAMKVLRIR